MVHITKWDLYKWYVLQNDTHYIIVLQKTVHFIKQYIY
jgi:hypothetical protein